jgi:hypothetical protein
MKKIFLIAIAATLVVVWAVYFRSNGKLGSLMNPINPIQDKNSPVLAVPIATATSTAKGTLSRPVTYYFKVTSLDYAGGQTAASGEFTCRVTSPKNSCVATVTLPNGASTTRIWIATTTGVYYGYKTATSSTLVATTTGLRGATLPQVGSAYLFNSGSSEFNSWLWSYATADKSVKSGPTFVHSVTYSSTDAAATAGTIVIRDGTSVSAATTTAFGVPAANVVPTTIILDQMLDNGLFVDFVTTADVNVNISYK